MNNKILNYYGNINAAYLHACAEGGTEFLLQELDTKNNETILELGFGTGATLVKIKAKHPQINLYGLEASELMLQKAISRLKFCGLSKKIQLQKTNTSQRFPYSDSFFDKIYAESVLGIQETEEIDFILTEALRTLKPNGKLIINETIWLPSIEYNEIETINKTCKNTFGIIQANAEYYTTLKWEQLFKRIGFSKTESKAVKPATNCMSSK